MSDRKLLHFIPTNKKDLGSYVSRLQSCVVLLSLYSSGSQFILKPAPRPEGKIIFAPLALFDALFFVSEKFTPQEVPSRNPNWEPLLYSVRCCIYNATLVFVYFLSVRFFLLMHVFYKGLKMYQWDDPVYFRYYRRGCEVILLDVSNKLYVLWKLW